MLVVQERQALLDAGAGVAAVTSAAAALPAWGPAENISISVHSDLDTVETLWRSFETVADGTVFQTFAWHAAWQSCIGAAQGVRPAIVVGRHRGRVLFILPLAVEPGRVASRLVWHARDLCDYNAPLLAPEFPEVIGDNFAGLFAEITQRVAGENRFDAVALTKMPEMVRGQPNPFLVLPTTLNPSGAYLMSVAGTWEEFYREKRSSATRRHDRSKRKHLAEFGPVSFVTAEDQCAIEATLDVLFAQKAASFAARGVSNFLARPGTRDFFRAVSADPSFRDIMHVSRLQVGSIVAAANLGLVFRGRFYHVLASYDAGPVSRFGPGTAHLHELIAYALARGCDIFDFTVGDEPYKRDWCDTEMKLHDFRAATSARGLVVAKVSVAMARAKRFVKRTPRLWHAVHRIRVATAALTRGRRPAPSRGSVGPDSTGGEP